MDKDGKFFMVSITVYAIIGMFSAIFFPINIVNLILVFMTIIYAINLIIFINLKRGISIKEMFKGEEFWKTFNIIFLITGIFLIPMLSLILFPYYIGWIIVGLVIIIPSYIVFYQYHLLKISRCS